MNSTIMNGIIGNTSLKERLCRDVCSNSLSHAYIIEGADGSGRRTIALMTAAAHSCKNKGESATLPCTSCINCRKILELKSPDVIFINSNGKASLGVDIARFLKEDVHVLPNDLEHKYYIIEDADKMTVQAQNALLLTLEEPPAFVHFFLLCNNSDTMLETIRSRAPTLRTEPISDSDIDACICSKSSKALQMKIASEKEYKELIKCADGSIGKALELLDSKVFNSLMDRRRFVNDFIYCAVSRSGAEKLLPILYSFSNKRDILTEQLMLTLNALRDLIALKKSDSPPLCFYSDINEAIELCDKVSLSFLFSFRNAISNAVDECRQNANVKLLLTKMAICAELV